MQVHLCDLLGLCSSDPEGRASSIHLQEQGNGIKAELRFRNGFFETAAAEKAKYSSSLSPSEEKTAQHGSPEATCINADKWNTILWNMLPLGSSYFCWVTLFVTEVLIVKLHSAFDGAFFECRWRNLLLPPLPIQSLCNNMYKQTLMPLSVPLLFSYRGICHVKTTEKIVSKDWMRRYSSLIGYEAHLGYIHTVLVIYL